MYRKFTTALDTVAPAVVSLRKEIKPQCPWMTPELLNILHNQKSMYRRVVRSKRQYLRAVREYRQLRNYNLYKQLKNNYFQQRLLNYRISPKPFWLTINHITGRQRQNLPTPVSLKAMEIHFQSLYTLPSDCQPNHIPEGPATKNSFAAFRPVSVQEE